MGSSSCFGWGELQINGTSDGFISFKSNEGSSELLGEARPPRADKF